MSFCCAARIRWGALTVACGVLLCAAGPAAAEGGKLYPGDLGQAIATFLTFCVLLFVLGKYAWKPIVAQLRRREEEVASTVNRAAEQQEEAENLLSHYQSLVEKAEAESKEVLATSRREATEARDQIITDARSESRRAIRTAQEEIRHAKEEVVRELRETTAELAADIAERVLGGGLRPEDHQRLVDQSLEEIRDRATEDTS